MKQESKQKEQFKDRLIEWAQSRLDTSFSNLNNIQQSRQMIHFFVTEVLERLAPGLVPDDEGELEGCIIDGAGDGGADFIYRSDEGQVVIIQAKFRGKDATEGPEQSVDSAIFLNDFILQCRARNKRYMMIYLNWRGRSTGTKIVLGCTLLRLLKVEAQLKQERN